MMKTMTMMMMKMTMKNSQSLFSGNVNLTGKQARLVSTCQQGISDDNDNDDDDDEDDEDDDDDDDDDEDENEEVDKEAGWAS